VNGGDRGGVMEVRVAGDFVEMTLVVHRRADDLPWVRDGASQGNLAERDGGGVWPERSSALENGVEMGDQQIAVGKGIAHRREQLERGRDIPHAVAVHEPEPIVVEAR